MTNPLPQRGRGPRRGKPGFRRKPRPARIEAGTHGLARVLSRWGVASRKEAAAWVASGRVTVEGAVVRDPERRTDPDRERIAVDGVPARAARKYYLVMNKPVGVVTTARDPQGRRTVYDVLREAWGSDPSLGAMPWLFPVGRLDANTLGLLIFTNDTALGDFLTDERVGVPKTYEVKVRRRMAPEAVARLRQGVTLEDGARTRQAECRVLQANEGSTWLEVTLREGRNRQVRRMCAAVGHEVVKLRRVRIGPIELGDLPAGAIRPLTRAEVDAIRRTS